MKNRTSSYIMTASPYSNTDMEQVNIVKKTVAISNKIARTNYKNAMICWDKGYTAKKPNKPTIYQVRLMGRGSRKVAAILDNRRKGAYDQYLPIKHATSYDVYVHMRNDTKYKAL